MRTDISTSIENALAVIGSDNSKPRIPVILLDIDIGSDVYYHISDRKIQFETPEELITYEPWVKSWGVNNGGSCSPDGILQGGFLEVPAQSLELVFSRLSKSFVSTLVELGVNNTTCELFFTLDGIDYYDRLRIGRYLLQDPVEMSESKMIFRLDMISDLMLTDPPIVDADAGKKRYPFVIGKDIGMPLDLVPDLSDPFCILSEDIKTNQVGKVNIENFRNFPGIEALPETGYLVIDEEYVEYNNKTDSSIDIISRGDRAPHSSGAGVYLAPYIGGQPVQSWSYAVCAGPVNALDNLKANNDIYDLKNNWQSAPYHVQTVIGGNLAHYIFHYRPPWLNTEIVGNTTPITPPPEYGDWYATVGSTDNSTGQEIYGVENIINDEDGLCTMRISSNTGGGATSRTVQSTDATSINLSTADPSNWSGFKNSLQGSFSAALDIDWDANVTTGAPISVIGPPDGETASITWTQGFNLAYLGTLEESSVYVRLAGSSRGVEVNITVKLIENDDLTEHILDTYNIDTYIDNYCNKVIDWPAEGHEYDISTYITDFALFYGCKLQVEVELVRLNINGLVSIEVTDIEWTAKYFDGPASGYPYQEIIVSDINASSVSDVTDMTVTANLWAILIDAEVKLELFYRFTDDSDNNIYLETLNISESFTEENKSYGLITIPPEQLENLRFGIRQTLVGPTTSGINRYATIFINRIWFSGTVQGPDYFDIPEKRVVFAENLTCDATGAGGADETPANAIARLMDTPGYGGTRVSDSFDAAHADYDAANYYFNGSLPGDSTYHSALREILKQGMARLGYVADGITLLPYWKDDDSSPVYTFSPDTDVIARSGSLVNSNANLITKGLILRTSYNYITGAYDSLSEAGTSPEPMEEEYNLIRDDTLAALICDRRYYLRSLPKSGYYFEVMIDKGLSLEKGDKVAFFDFLAEEYKQGNILDIKQVFQDGVSGQINKYQISVFNPQPYTLPAPPPENDNFADAIAISGLYGDVIDKSSVGATRETGEPYHAGGTGTHSLWYDWTCPATGEISFLVESDGFNPVIGVYTGTSISSLTEVTYTTRDPDLAEFEATAGISYKIAIDGSTANDFGTFSFDWIPA